MLILNVLKSNAIQYNKNIKNKKANLVRNQLQKDTKKPKELWKALKNIGLLLKAAQISKICLKERYFTQFDDNLMQTILRILLKAGIRSSQKTSNSEK